jgi:metal-responsive CopG/Arc/MetJ family transcriptional regulator
MPRKTTDPAEERHTVQVRFPTDLLEAVDREAERLSRERGGEAVGRSEVIRIAVRRALMGADREPTKKGTKR